MKHTKHIIITGDERDAGPVAHKILDIIPKKWVMALSKKTSRMELARMDRLPYIRAVLVRGVDDAQEIMSVTKSIELFNTDIAIVFTCQKMCAELREDNRYNIIQLGY